MTVDPTNSTTHLSEDRLDQICDAFETAWVAGERPTIKAFLPLGDERSRHCLLYELILVDVELRNRRGEKPSRAEYLQQFPEFAEQIRRFEIPGVDPLPGSEKLPTEASEELSLSETRTLIRAAPLTNQRYGRYRVVSILGEGAFGRVYLGYDDELQRQVAIKVPTPNRFRNPDDAELYLAEARNVASLDHPNIVPVHDVGRTDTGSIYVVSKFIKGSSLRDIIKSKRPTYEKSAPVMAAIAKALHHAHLRHLIHRDIKPANLLVDEDAGTPYVADFGLAIREEIYLPDATIVGTPAYMSPEQARGEGHRLDGRSDIFSLGAVYYELLTGAKAFRGSSDYELLHQVTTLDPIPPRDVDDAIPPELERICLKALSKRASDRYVTAADMAEDLLHWQQGLSLNPSEPKIVPRGLRSFDADDASFFLDLLPGPRDRDGLPESLHFWKQRVEETDPDKTFSVGLIYGPSGCGKSSLIKAGLLPRLSDDILAIYIEATPTETEPRILRAIRRFLPDLPVDESLSETMAELRRRRQGKVLIVLDQFEQWLHTHGELQHEELVSALRQCDGGSLQALVMIRDDFAMAAARFMNELDVPIRQGYNFATVDLFGVDHAKKVLTKFGQAYGRLPDKTSDISDREKHFVNEVAWGLAQDGKVISVRLALFAEMVKDRTWEPQTLEELGGTVGVGINFLEESFNSRSANPLHRLYQEGIRRVLGALLPEVGTDIKGHMRPYSELLDAAGYAKAPGEFEQLLMILDGELRLITPTDAVDGRSGSNSGPGSKYYQLTHDYLVPLVREWLTRHQKDSRRGRAELRLAERAAIWNARPENRQLPSLWEYLSIVSCVPRRNRTPSQQQMMNAAKKVLGLRWLTGCALVVTILAGFIIIWNRVNQAQHLEKVNGLVDQLFVADITELPPIVEALDKEANLTDLRLATIADDSNRTNAERIRATLPLADQPDDRAVRLIGLTANADVQTARVVRDRLAPFAGKLKTTLWEAMHRNSASSSPQLRIAALLATADPMGEDWKEMAPAVVDALLEENTLDLDGWVALLRPSADALIPTLAGRFRDTSITPIHRELSARVLAVFAKPDLLAELLLQADGAQFTILLSGAAHHREEVLDEIQKALRRLDNSAEKTDDILHKNALRNAAIAMLRLDNFLSAEPYFKSTTDPDVRTLLLLELQEFGVSPDNLLAAFNSWSDPVARQAALLAMEPYFGRHMSPEVERTLFKTLPELLEHSPHQAERSAAEWLLRRWNREEIITGTLAKASQTKSPAASLADRDWWLTPEGFTMVVVRSKVDSSDKKSSVAANDASPSAAQYRFAVSAHEVTMEQFKRFQPNAKFAYDVAKAPLCPANKVSFKAALQYCQWLSQQEGLPADQRCYGEGPEPDTELASITEPQRLRTGYRLLTADEWEFVCRAGAKSTFFFGNREQNLKDFGWFAQNASEQLHPVGTLRPNPLGLFDIAGNAAEWCHTLDTERHFLLRGGAYHDPASKLASAEKFFQSSTGYSYTGFRVARTIASPD